MNGSDAQTITLMRVIRASPERVFDAWLNPRAIAVWMCPGEIFESLAEIDARVGGRFQIIMRSPGHDNVHEGVYERIDRPTLLAFTWRSASTRYRDTHVTVAIRAHPRGAEVTLTHTGLPGEDAAALHLIGWKAHLRSLMRHFNLLMTDFRAILFTDLEDHSRLVSRLGDRAARTVLRDHESILRDALRGDGGEEVKMLGDGMMASFPSAAAAVRCAATVQQRLETPVAGEALRMRIGISAGEPIAEGRDLHGLSVITAARIAARCDGGQVLVANVVRELVWGHDFRFAYRGEHELKGIAEPVRLWELRS